MVDCEVILFNVEDIIDAVNTFFELGIEEDVDTCGYCIRITHPAYSGVYVPFTVTEDDIKTLEENNVEFFKLREISIEDYYYVH